MTERWIIAGVIAVSLYALRGLWSEWRGRARQIPIGLRTGGHLTWLGGARVARAWAAIGRKSTHEPIEIELNGQLGLVLSSGDGHRTALTFVIDNGRIARIDAIRNPEKLRHL